MAYQSIQGFGDSDSLSKLDALFLPSLEGKSFLDVGCNEGFFCGFAMAAGARLALGVDFNAEAIANARKTFPNATFQDQHWDRFFEGNQQKFDIILCSSALHYAPDQDKMISCLLDHLSDQGTLVLEAGVFLESNQSAGYVTVDRWDGPKQYPTLEHIQSVVRAKGFSVFKVGRSVDQPGDAVARYALHIRRRRTPILLNFDPTDHGKTELGVILSEQGTTWHSIDIIILDILARKNDQFLNLIGPDIVTLQNYMDGKEVVAAIIAAIENDPSDRVRYVEGFLNPVIIEILKKTLEEKGIPYYIVSAGKNNFVSKVPGSGRSVMTEDGAVFLTRSKVFGHVDNISILARPPHYGAMVSGWFVKSINVNTNPHEIKIFLSVSNVPKLGNVVKTFERKDVGEGGIGFEAYIPLNMDLVKSIALERIMKSAPIEIGVLGVGRDLYPLGLDEAVFQRCSIKASFL